MRAIHFKNLTKYCVPTFRQTGDKIVYNIFTTENNLVAICLLGDALKLFWFKGATFIFKHNI